MAHGVSLSTTTFSHNSNLFICWLSSQVPDSVLPACISYLLLYNESAQSLMD